MSHIAKINTNSVVTQIIVSEQDFINSGEVGDSFLWVQTSYNHNFRKQFAGIGCTYDKTNDVFIVPQPYPSWTLDDSFDWQPPTAIPDEERTLSISPDYIDKERYEWNEDTKSWEKPSS